MMCVVLKKTIIQYCKKLPLPLCSLYLLAVGAGGGSPEDPVALGAVAGVGGRAGVAATVALLSSLALGGGLSMVLCSSSVESVFTHFFVFSSQTIC